MLSSVYQDAVSGKSLLSWIFSLLGLPPSSTLIVMPLFLLRKLLDTQLRLLTPPPRIAYSCHFSHHNYQWCRLSFASRLNWNSSMLNILYYCILTNPFSLSSFEVTRKPVEKISESASVDFFFLFFCMYPIIISFLFCSYFSPINFPTYCCCIKETKTTVLKTNPSPPKKVLSMHAI